MRLSLVIKNSIRNRIWGFNTVTINEKEWAVARMVSSWIIAFVIVFGILGWFFWSDIPHGENNVRTVFDYGKFALVACATFTGVISNGVYERLTGGRTTPELLRGADVIFAAIVAPVVLLPIYRSLGDLTDPLVIGLTAYQNGFFFNVIFDKVRKSALGGSGT